jgi:hypothetical protein
MSATPGRSRFPAILTALLATAALTGCAGDPPHSDPAGVDELTIPTPTPDPGDFVDGVDNPWFPLVPGTVLTYRSTGEDGTQTDTVTVTDDTRVVAGVTTVVVHDVATDASGKVVEDTYDWYAQDTAGNVWYFGEDTTAYDGGRADTEGSWEAGVDGAEAGLIMAATPRVGDGYRQEYRAGVAEDQAEVLSLTEQRDVPAGTFADLVQTEDTTPLEPGLVELKYYAKGLGVVFEETIAGGSERVELVDVTRP